MYIRFFIDVPRTVTYYINASNSNYDAIQKFKHDVEHFDELYYANSFCPYVVDDLILFEESDVDRLCQEDPHRHRKVTGSHFEWHFALDHLRVPAFNNAVLEFEMYPEKWENYYIQKYDKNTVYEKRIVPSKSYLKLVFNQSKTIYVQKTGNKLDLDIFVERSKRGVSKNFQVFNVSVVPEDAKKLDGLFDMRRAVVDEIAKNVRYYMEFAFNRIDTFFY